MIDETYHGRPKRVTWNANRRKSADAATRGAARDIVAGQIVDVPAGRSEAFEREDEAAASARADAMEAELE